VSPESIGGSSFLRKLLHAGEPDPFSAGN
jgi:hypothetical protein